MKSIPNIPYNPNEIIGNMPSDTDPNGSYTGVPYTAGEIPVQDADDL
jgi:hypothetical protein